MQKIMKHSENIFILEVDNGLEVGGLYRHFKGGIYEIIDFASCSKTCETLVIYRAYKTQKLWTRSIQEFLDFLDNDNYVGARFQKLLL